MKRFLAITLIISVCFLQGCGSKQLDERMVIQGIGIDYIDDKYSVTVMYMNTDSDKQDVSHKTVTGKGRTITEAVTDIVNQNGLEPLYSHNSFILLGKSICEYGVEEALEFFAGYYQCRPSVNVLVTNSDAKKLMFLKEATPDLFASIATPDSQTGKTIATPMYIFLSDIINKETSAFTAMITENEDIPVADGIAVFNGDKFNCKFNGTETMGILLVRGNYDISTEVIPLNGKNKSFSLSNEKIDVSVNVEKGVLYCNINLNAEANVYEFTTRNKSEDEIKNKIETRINQIIENSLKKCAENKSDLLYLGKRLRQSNYKMYSTIDNWDRFIENGVYSVNSNISVN